MSAETLTLVAGALLSLACSYLPGLAPRFDTLTATQKRLTMLALLAATAAGIYALTCWPPLTAYTAGLGLAAECGPAAIGRLIQVFFLAAMANQTTYALTPQRP
jgi:hypothetical protein